ncbi:murein hydrolase activator EnvC family protein [Tunicatimonas pelagia]|uniref:murein hydrolase activator EnvC family protein n=1 Tax=Tunicatimonas pelagia TaxID=931531 RepID=UPI002665F728|nr:peptidoglycan DD-metalloendopeptidase family protein [Tunicatimonas pelagia]WKN41463.1 peptidoglycan DD-metalloendopeptidase family protein [Tunicatimonas pelagia]
MKPYAFRFQFLTNTLVGSFLGFRSLLLGICLVFSVTVSWAQQSPVSREQLEKEKKENLQRIKEAQRILSETSSRRESSIGQLNAINEQIQARESLIQSISQELELLATQINELGGVIVALEEDLVNLKEEYAHMVYATSKTSNSYNRLTFLFSAETFNQLFRRIKYMQQYSQARKNQVNQIQKVRETLINQRETIESKRLEQQVLLDQQVIANQDLIALKTKQRALIRDLSQKEKQLRKEVAKRRNDVQRLERLIAKLIKEEIEESAKNKTENAVALNTSKEELSTSFASKKSKLLWPVNSGFISQRFGNNPHPVMKNILVPNDGVDIQTNQNAQVKAVFDGVVIAITPIPGPGNSKAIIMQHGEYFTVYSRLKDVNVRKGQAVRAEEPVGMVYTDSDGISALQFQIWHNQQKLNPEPWLQRR